MSAWWLLREEVVREAKVLALVLNKAVFGDEVGGNEEGEVAGKELPEGEMGAEWSD
jgi:hypothetical protein